MVEDARSSAGDLGPQPCTFCGVSEVLVPYTALPCNHRFCYYCLRSNCEADIHFSCPRCSVRVAAMRRWRPASHADS